MGDILSDLRALRDGWRDVGKAHKNADAGAAILEVVCGLDSLILRYEREEAKAGGGQTGLRERIDEVLSEIGNAAEMATREGRCYHVDRILALLPVAQAEGGLREAANKVAKRLWDLSHDTEWKDCLCQDAWRDEARKLIRRIQRMGR